jgi:uncharacterized protein YacL
VVLAAGLGWWLTGPDGAPYLAALAGAAAGLAAIGLEWSLRGVAPRRVLGGLAGLAAAWLVLSFLPEGAWQALALGGLPAGVAALVLALAFGWVGVVTGARELSRLSWPRESPLPVARAVPPQEHARPASKVVDTSVIIDGRIRDVVQSGFVEGPLVVPQFVIRELQQVADSSDPLKRARGRKGLDVLKVLQESDRIEVQLIDRDFPEIDDVDAKLLALAEDLGAKVLTNDYNLNKVAQLRGVVVLNVNDLANAVKPVVLPGESLSVQVIKEGKERNQGVGYLDDGTMIVVDNAREQLGERLDVLVTSVIQTNAGKMIFASLDEEREETRPRVVRREGRSDGPPRDSNPGVRPPT